MMEVFYRLTVSCGIADEVVLAEMLVDSEGRSGRCRGWRGVSQGKAGVVLCLAALHEAARALSFRHGLPWRGVRGASVLVSVVLHQ